MKPHLKPRGQLNLLCDFVGPHLRVLCKPMEKKHGAGTGVFTALFRFTFN